MNKRSARRAAILAAVAAAAAILIWRTGALETDEPKETPVPVIAKHTGELERPYTDWLQQEIPFGYASIYLAPWRAYMDTWDAQRYLDALGIVFNVSDQEADATARLLAEAGFTSARVEIGWGNVDYDDETRLQENRARSINAKLQALRKYGIRPLILLNANAGAPVPSRQWDVQLTRAARAGDREIYVDNTDDIAADYTGLTQQAYQTMFPVITGIDNQTGRLTLSAPLAKDLEAGPLRLVRLKYRPLSGTKFASGDPNPAAGETIEGWKRYVQTVTNTVKSALGTMEDRTDAGFDLEVWNELSFGSQYLDINNYYDPPLEFSEFPSYTLGGTTQTGGELLLPLTIDYVRQPDNRLPGVRVISGFASQRPWENGAQLYPGQAGFSRHYYTGFTPKDSIMSADNKDIKRALMVNAEGSGEPEDRPFLPTHVAAMPELWFYGYRSEFIVRDLQPFPGPWSPHYRYARAEDGRTAEVWMTETNWWRWPFAEQVIARSGVREDDPRLHALMQEIGAKTTLRLFTFYSHKGVETVNVYAAKGGDLNYGVIADGFFSELAANGYRLTDAARRRAGPQIEALTRLAGIMRAGEPIANPRPLQVSRVQESDELLVLKGDGTAEHPDIHARDDLAILPFQLSDRKFAIGYYVATRDITQAWQPDLDMLDPNRYAMPSRTFEITLDNLAGEHADAHVYDPRTDAQIPVRVTDRTANSLTLELESVDYPRFLMLEEDEPGPLITETGLVQEGEGAVFTFKANVRGEAKVSWGPYPMRKASSFKEEYYLDLDQPEPAATRTVESLNQLALPGETGVWRWTGTLEPSASGDYSFILNTDSCEVSLRIDGLNVINGCGNPVTFGTIKLAAGQSYQMELYYASKKASPHQVTLYWAGDGLPKQPVAAAAESGAGQAAVSVTPGVPVSVRLPGFREGDGVMVTLDSGPLRTRFPFWQYDVRGTLLPPR